MIIYQEDGSTVIIQGTKVSPVVRWETWFMIPMGLVKDASEAIKVLVKEEFPLNLIKPVSVAVAEDGTHEVSQ